MEGDTSTRHPAMTSTYQPKHESGRPARSRREAGLREREQVFRATFDRAVIGIAHVSPQGRWLRINRRLRDLLGYDRAELATRTYQDIIHPDDRDACGACLRRLLAGELNACKLDTRFIRKDGTPIWVQLTTSLVRTRGGEPDYFIAMVQDISGRKRLEQERAQLLERERAARAEAETALAQATASEARAAERATRLNTILDTITDGVVVYDAEGRPVQLTNRAYRELYAVARAPEYESLRSRDRARLLHLRDAAGAQLPFERTPVARALRGEVVTGPGADIRVRALDGRELEVNSSAAPLREPDGRVVGAVLVLRDMTERNRLAREREAARADELATREVNRRMEQFLATAAHDLRAPLTATVGFIGLTERQFQLLAAAARDASPDLARQIEAAQERLGEANRSAERLARLVEVLFDTTALRAGQLDLRRTPHDLAALVREQVEGQRAAAPGRTIRLHAAAGRPVLVEADADRIGQVVANYLSNALKYSPPDQPIDVSVAAHIEGEKGWVRVAVRDRGPGLPEAERERVWELFHRAPGVAVAPQGATQGATQGGSLGMGLYISKVIVEAHGGRVGVESVVARGSTFWFALPLS